MRIKPMLAAVTLVSLGSQAFAFDPDEERGERVLVEVGLGLGGTAVGAIVGGLVGLGIGEAAGECDRMFGCLFHSFLGAAVGGFGGMVTGVYLGGYAMEANGGAGWTLLGGVGGLALAGGIQAIGGGEIDGLIAGIMWITFPLTGAILGYELSTEETLGRRSSAFTLALPPISF